MSFAPVIIFCCNRPKKLEQLLESLKLNLECKDSDLFIYIDKPKNKKFLDVTSKILEIAELDWGFGSKKIILRSKNFGLKANIFQGVSEVIEKYKKAIILEDDLIVSSSFLNYMNNALNKYETNSKVWHISGYSLDLIYKNYSKSYFTKEMNCWGWGTWYKEWSQLENNFYDKLKNLERNEIKKFNFDGFNKNNYNQILLNEENKINTWAIFWYQTIFLNEGFCLNPCVSFVSNNGFDNSGEHNSNSTFYEISKLNSTKNITFPIKDEINKFYQTLIKYKYFRYSISDFITYHLRKLT